MGGLGKSWKSLTHEVKNLARGRVHIGRWHKMVSNNRISNIVNPSTLVGKYADKLRKRFERTSLGGRWRDIYRNMWAYDKHFTGATNFTGFGSSAKSNVGSTGFHRYV